LRLRQIAYSGTFGVVVIRIRGYALPRGESVDLYADGDRWTTDPVPGAELVGEGWLVPGLVDAHTHPGATEPGQSMDTALLREQLHQHVDAGVTLIRSPGLPGEPPAWFGEDPDVPRARHAGPWLAQHGQFFDGWGRRADHDELPAMAAKQAASTGWAKLIADWRVGDTAIPVDVLTAVVREVHAVGGRVAVHSQHPEGGAAAVAAGVDSLEHGMCLDAGLLAQMASQGTALTPTLSFIVEGLAGAHRRPDSPQRTWYLRGAGAHASLTASAAEAGVRVLAGTDSLPHGGILTEVLALAEAGMHPHDALGAASWQAREYLGLPGLEPGAPADAVIYDEDPRKDLRQLADPVAVVLRGRCVRSRR
jgi:imidazolonepropionase-like amidohydrolase